MKSIPLKKLLAALILLLSPLTMLAQEAYAVYTESNTTLTFYFDTQRNSRSGTKYDLNSGTNSPGWYSDSKYRNVTKVVFAASFKNARPTSTYFWFYYMINLTSITGMKEYLNTSDVANMSDMFSGCSKLTSLDVSGFNTDNVTNMNWMFSSCSSLTSLDVSGFNTENVTTMRQMFRDCSKLESLDVSGFNTDNVTNMEAMFLRCSSLTTIYCDKNWNKTGLTSTDMFSGCSSLKGGNGTAFDISHGDAAYAHPDETDNPGYFTGKAYAALNGTTLTFYYDTQRDTRSGTIFNVIPLEHGDDPEWSDRSDIHIVDFDPSFADYQGLERTGLFFRDLDKLTTINHLEYMNTMKVTDMSNMFDGCKALQSLDLSSFNTSNVTEMTCMFYNCSSLTSLDVSGFNTENVYDMMEMFYGCSSLTSLDVSGFNTARVSNMEYMFSGCSSLTTIYCDKNWNKSSGLDSGYMFKGCTSLKGGNGTVFNSSNVTATYARPDGGTSNPGYFTLPPSAYAELSDNDDGTTLTLTFYYDNKRSTRGMTYDLNIGTSSPGWYSDDNCKNVSKVVFDSSFRDARPTSTTYWFCGMTSLASITGMKEYLNTSKVTNMSFMFYNCVSVESLDVSAFNTSTVTDMSNMFGYCSSLTSLDVSNFNTEKVTNMGGMFAGCTGLTDLNVSGFNTEKVTNMGWMFYNCSNMTTIYCNDNWNRSGLNSDYMFTGCTSLKGGNGTEFDDTHIDATYAHLDIAGNPGYFSIPPYAALSTDGKTLTFYCDTQRSTRGTTYGLNIGSNYPGWYSDGKYADVTTVVFDSSFKDARPTSTTYWFFRMTSLASITGMKEYLNTSEVTTMTAMFGDCFSLTSLDVSSFNTEKVTDMCYMFQRCSSLTSIDVSSFNTEKVTDMSMMFWYCSKLTTIYCDNDWHRPSVLYSYDMFLGCTSLKGGNGTTYKYSNRDATYARPDGGTSNPGYFTLPPSAYAELSDNDDGTTLTLTFYYDGKRSTRGTTYDLNSGSNKPGWYTDGKSKNVTTVVFDSSFKDARPTSTTYWFFGMTSLASITGMKENLNTSEVTNMSYMFYGCSSLTSLDLSGFNTENVTTMNTMFWYCSSLKSLDLSNFNTANVTDMYDMFAGCSSLKSLDVSGFNTEKVENMGYMFYNCSSLTSLDVSGFNTANVTYMRSMFSGCSSLTSLDVSGFNTENVTYMYYMFSDCSSLTSLDVSGFNTDNVTDMSYMFSYCSSLESLDVSNFNTEKVKDMYGMFFGCSSLTTIICDNDWNKDELESTNMFLGCEKLKGGNGTTFYWSNTDATYAHPDAAGNPGYFTKFVKGDANGDGKVTITDAVAVVNYILGSTQGVFIKRAADVDGNGDISITDAVGIVNIILNSSPAGVKERRVLEEIVTEREPD